MAEPEWKRWVEEGRIGSIEMCEEELLNVLSGEEKLGEWCFPKGARLIGLARDPVSGIYILKVASGTYMSTKMRPQRLTEEFPEHA